MERSRRTWALPAGCWAGDNANAFLGGFRLWKPAQNGSAASGGGKEPLMGMSPLTARPAWKALQAHREMIGKHQLRSLFAEDPTRGERLTAEAVGIYLDYSKNRITDETLTLLRRLADEC